jgi:thiaminase/transcriptional activator TenA
MTFSTDAWSAIADIRGAIDELPFLTRLADGSLDHEVFRHYLTQDALYLADYGRVLAAAASQSTDPDDLIFWAQSARTTVVVERELHAAHVADLADLAGATPSPTCRAYTAYLWSLAGGGCYPALVAGILPCFWIYDDVGRRMRERVGDPGGHAFGDWIATYGDPEFAASTARAREIVDRVAAESSPAVVARMHEAFTTAARYEWMFWDAPMRLEAWPV